jgi:hypothetical protein
MEESWTSQETNSCFICSLQKYKVKNLIGKNIRNIKVTVIFIYKCVNKYGFLY